MNEPHLKKVLITAMAGMVTFLAAGIAVSPVFAEGNNQTIRVLLPNGVPPGAQGQIEVDVRRWRSDEIETLTLEVPVVTDPAPMVTFDPSIGNTITGRVGEPLDIPFTIADPGMNNLVVEYLLNGEVLTADPVGTGITPIELESTVQGVLPFIGVQSDGGYGEDYMFGGAYYSFSLPDDQYVGFNVFYENNGGYSGYDITGVVHIYRNDGDLTVDDYETSRYVGFGGGEVFLEQGDYVFVLVASENEILIESLANGEPYACEFICPQENIQFELSIFTFFLS